MTRKDLLKKWGGWFLGPFGRHPAGARGQFTDDLDALLEAECAKWKVRAEKAEAERDEWVRMLRSSGVLP